mmetsp:Transcript_40616/g.77995  ORF Transcript_40616/g.77995 Transcript_40616/m.77995 type:complete len:166 (+) Transcript_40616:52-549(+)
MHKVKHEHLPDVQERRVFPFRASQPSSPAASTLSASAMAQLTQRLAPQHGPRPFTITAHGIELIAEPGPTIHQAARSRSSTTRSALEPRRSGMANLHQTHPRHAYTSSHEFGHHSIANDVNPFLAHDRLPKWETTSSMYGVHYKHPQQTYSIPVKNRMPVFNVRA